MDEIDSKKNVVMWSGGADSTLVLTELLANPDAQFPVTALTVDSHPNLNVELMARERAARKRFKSLARKRGYRLIAKEISISAEGGLDAGTQQSLWMSTLMQYVEKGSCVHFGYVRGDDFWHVKAEAIALASAMWKMRDGEASVELCFDLEYVRKPEVLKRLALNSIPDSCWWSCETPVKRSQCNGCWKCWEIAQAKSALKSKVYEKAQSRFG